MVANDADPDPDPESEIEPHPTHALPVHEPYAQRTATTPAMDNPHRAYQHPSHQPDVTQQQFQEAIQQRDAAEHQAQGWRRAAARLNQLWRNSERTVAQQGQVQIRWLQEQMRTNEQQTRVTQQLGRAHTQVRLARQRAQATVRVTEERMIQERERYDGLQGRFAELERTSARFAVESQRQRRGRVAAEDKVRTLERELEAEKAERARLERLRSLRNGSNRE